MQVMFLANFTFGIILTVQIAGMRIIIIEYHTTMKWHHVINL